MPKGTYDRPKITQEMIDAYFKDCDENKRPYTVAGLCEALGMEKEYFLGYRKTENKNWKYGKMFGAARRKILRYAEEQLFLGGKNSSGILFFIKQNFGDESDEAKKKKNEPKKITIVD